MNYNIENLDDISQEDISKYILECEDDTMWKKIFNILQWLSLYLNEFELYNKIGLDIDQPYEEKNWSYINKEIQRQMISQYLKNFDKDPTEDNRIWTQEEIEDLNLSFTSCEQVLDYFKKEEIPFENSILFLGNIKYPDTIFKKCVSNDISLQDYKIAWFYFLLNIEGFI